MKHKTAAIVAVSVAGLLTGASGLAVAYDGTSPAPSPAVTRTVPSGQTPARTTVPHTTHHTDPADHHATTLPSRQQTPTHVVDREHNRIHQYVVQPHSQAGVRDHDAERRASTRNTATSVRVHASAESHDSGHHGDCDR